MTFTGSECYFSTWNTEEGKPGMTGKPFREVVFHFADAAVLGVRFANLDSPEVLSINPTGRPVMLNPPGDYIMQLDDRILVAAEDDDTYHFGASNHPEKTPVPPFDIPPPEPGKYMLAGWRRDMDDIIKELDKWVAPGSTLTVFNRLAVEDQVEKLAMGGLDLTTAPMCMVSGHDNTYDTKKQNHMENIVSLELIQGDCCRGVELERLGPESGTRFRLEEYDSVLTLSVDNSIGSGMSADSRVMVSMLIMRHIQMQRGQEHKVLVAEIRDPRTQELMEFTKCTDSIVGNEIIAMILAQISEDRDIGYVMEDLFSEEGMEMHVKDVRIFAAPREELNWWEMVDRCMQRIMLPLGWIRKNGSHHSPWKADGDLIIVISEN